MKFYCRFKPSILFGLALALFVLVSCRNNEFSISGDIEGAKNLTILLEKADFQGRWNIIDSTHLSSNGHFSFSRPAPVAPEIFRIVVDGKYIYFPIDSIESIKLHANFDKLPYNYTLSGSDKAANLALFENSLANLPLASSDSLKAFKKRIYTEFMQSSPGSIVTYYILTKTIDSKPIFDINNPDDYKYFAAVATGFKTNSPDDPRTALLENVAVEALKSRNSQKGNFNEILAEETGIIDMVLPDENGIDRKLSDYTGKGKPVVVVFSLMNTADSPAINKELADLYKSHNGNLEIYQVSFDSDQFAWKESASNIPWITVFDGNGLYSKNLASYNVTEIPVFFIYDSKGELSSRAESFEQLRSRL